MSAVPSVPVQVGAPDAALLATDQRVTEEMVDGAANLTGVEREATATVNRDAQAQPPAAQTEHANGHMPIMNGAAPVVIHTMATPNGTAVKPAATPATTAATSNIKAPAASLSPKAAKLLGAVDSSEGAATISPKAAKLLADFPALDPKNAPTAATGLGWVPQESPEVRANWLSKLTFWWLTPIVKKGEKTPLMDEDMYEVKPTVDAKYLSDRFDVEWAIELKRRDESLARGDAKPYNPDLTKAMYRIFKTPFWLGGVCKALIDGLAFLQPNLLQWMLAFLAENQRANVIDPPLWRGYVLAVALGVVPLLTTVLNNLYFSMMMTIGMQMRTILITQLYKKSLRLAPGAKQAMSVGQIVNMMSTDSSKVDLFMGYIHYLWSAIEQVIIAIALLVRAIGPSALAGVAVVVIMIPVQGLVMKKLQDLRRATVKYTDARVKLMNEIMQGIRVIKVYAWEGSFLQKLLALRAEEMRFVRKASVMRAWNSVLMQTGPLLMSLLSFIVLGLTSDTFDAQYIFQSLVLFNLLRMPLLLFPMTLAFWSDARIGVRRISAFLLAEELASEPEYVQTDAFALNIDHASFTWDRVAAVEEVKHMSTKEAARETAAKEVQPLGKVVTQPVPAKTPEQGALLAADADSAAPVEENLPFHLDDINFKVPKGSLTVIVGAVGSGKSSLLAGILGEMKRADGRVQISGSLGFVPQQAWIQNATLKENVLFGKPFDEKKYAEAIKYSALQADINVLPARDATEIGEKGINLSGGQKQRVNLARAVYYDADIIILDDPLSAVDAHVSKYLFNSCICEKLQDKTRLLVTHQLQYVSSCDYVLFVENGRITEQGTYQQLMAEKKNFFTLMSTYVGEEDEPSSEDEAVTTSSEPGAPQEESKDNGAAQTKSLGAAKKSKGLSTAKSSAGLRKHSSAAQQELDEVTAEAKRKKAEEEKVALQLMQAEERTKGGVPIEIYMYYMKHTGGWLLFVFAFLLLGLQTAASTWSTWWLNLWSDREYDERTSWYLGIYAGIGLGQCLFSMVGTVIMAWMGILAAKELHNKSFASVMRAPMSFFDTTPIGRIISRFSKDQDVIDSLLMDTLRMIIFMILSVISTFVMICIVTPIFLAPLAPILVLYWYVQRMYRETSRELKRIESISRSPLYAHFSETLTGLATIRAYRAQPSFIRGNQFRMNGNNRSYYLLILTQRWLSIRVETIGALISFFAALFVVIQRNSLNVGEAGVSLTYAISVTALLNWVVRQTVEAENNMNSVERSKFYTDSIAQEAPALVPEADAPLQIAPAWPQRGAIQFRHLQVRYRDGLPLVLHGITLDIKGGERVGIVGRTGAGKSSLMVALFRIVEAAGGSILIDGVDISKIGLDALRTKLAIIPQDPVLYSGTVRSNLDPFNQYSDAELWSVLEKAYLKEAISALELKLLDPVSENGENFSVGQRCQICLARAMLRNARVLIMDEATASVDFATDSLIQTSLRTHFDCTLLTIAHRLNTICDYDRVLVLSFGEVAEFDSPANLLRNPNSIFTSMVNETGEVNAALLRSIAFKAEQGIRVDANAMLGEDGRAGEYESAVSPSHVNATVARGLAPPSITPSPAAASASELRRRRSGIVPATISPWAELSEPLLGTEVEPSVSRSHIVWHGPEEDFDY